MNVALKAALALFIFITFLHAMVAAGTGVMFALILYVILLLACAIGGVIALGVGLNGAVSGKEGKGRAAIGLQLFVTCILAWMYTLVMFVPLLGGITN